MTTTLEPVATAPEARKHWIEDWEPENPAFWEATG